MPKRSRKGEDIPLDDVPPTTINPYTILSLPADASPDAIKKAYRQAALKHHPDKAAPEDKDAAHTKFQEIAFAFAILSDERRRRRYDLTGRTEESLDLDEDGEFDWAEFYREQFAEVVSEESIRRFAEGYRGSEEEAEAVREAYVQAKGAMRKVYEVVMLSDMAEDEERFRKIIDKAIEEGDVEAFDKYMNETPAQRKKRVERARKEKEEEAGEAEEALEEIKQKKTAGKNGKKGGKEDGGLGDLAALIQQRQKGRSEDFFAHLEEKYAPKGGKGGKRAAVDEPSEEAFAKNAKKGKNGRSRA